ncbi:MAG TPA: hypothetical protein EYF95_00790 [Flavobacteriales bacterium]|jgi:hypothetical protein|nr:hypothetical protein [Flavobacteriales bacterium]
MLNPSDRDKIDIYTGRFEQLRTLRSNWEGVWNDITNYILPTRGDFTVTRAKGAPRHDLIYDGTGPWANEQLAAGLAGFLTSPTQRWFKLKMSDAKLNEQRSSREYLEKVESILYDHVFNSPHTNFTPQTHELYLDIGAFGTSVMLIEDQSKGINFQTFHLGNCYIAEGMDGKVNTVYRTYLMTARQIMEKYEGVFSKEQVEVFKKKPYEEHECLHIVEPNDQFLPDSVKSTNKEYISVFIFLGSEKAILEESGYDVFPYVVPRWQKTAEETYGRGPGSTALPDIKMVNEMMKTIIKSGQKVTDPPLMVPDDGFLLPIRTTPAGINFYRSGSQDRIEPLPVAGRLDIGFDLLKNRHEHIMRVFHIDIMRMKEDGPEMTATEVMSRQEEKMRNIAPMTGRMQVEFLAPMIRRTYHIANRQKIIPPIPDSLKGRGIDIEYSSPVARAQKATQLQNVTRLLEAFVPLINIKPEMADNFNGDEYFEWAHDLLDAPEVILEGKAKVQQIRQARMKAQEGEMQKQDMERAASGGVDVAKAQSLMQDASNQ